MNGIKIKGVGKYVPENIISNDYFAEILDTSDEWITARTGIKNRHHCRPAAADSPEESRENHTKMCIEAAKAAIERSGIKPEEIGACIVATASADNMVPATACMVQAALGMNEDTLCFDLSAACTGFVFGLHTMECLLNASSYKYGLVIGAEQLSRIIDREDRGTCILFGDGAGAAVVECREGWKPVTETAVVGSRGNSAALKVPGINSSVPEVISMDGKQVFKFAVETVPRCMDAVLEKAGCTPQDVDFFVFHQANKRIIDAAVKKYQLPAEKIHLNLQEYGNTSAASVPLVLAEIWEQGKVKSGSRMLIVAFGGGLTWGGMLIEFA